LHLTYLAAFYSKRKTLEDKGKMNTEKLVKDGNSLSSEDDEDKFKAAVQANQSLVNLNIILNLI
jgi:hypothetical protein